MTPRSWFDLKSLFSLTRMAELGQLARAAIYWAQLPDVPGNDECGTSAEMTVRSASCKCHGAVCTESLGKSSLYLNSVKLLSISKQKSDYSGLQFWLQPVSLNGESASFVYTICCRILTLSGSVILKLSKRVKLSLVEGLWSSGTVHNTRRQEVEATTPILHSSKKVQKWIRSQANFSIPAYSAKGTCGTDPLCLW